MLYRDTSLAGKTICDAGYVQMREWMLYKIRPDHYPLNVSIRIETETFSPTLFGQVIGEVISRHELLRTSLKVVDGRLCQLIQDPYVPADLVYWNIMDKPEPARDAFIKERMKIESFVPFNFEVLPTFRTIVFERAANFYIIYFVFHHLIADQRSLRVFHDEVVRAFRVVTGGQSPGVARRPVQYREYIRLETDLLETAKGDLFRDYWKKQLSGGIPELLIASPDRRRENDERYRLRVKDVEARLQELDCYDARFMGSVIRRFRTVEAGILTFSYPMDTVGRIERFREDSHHGLLALFIAGLLLSLNRICGQQRFVFDIPASVRMHRQFEETMGWLTTGGLCFFHLEEERAPATLLEYLDEQLYLLSEYCLYPFEAAIYDAGLPVAGRVPAFVSLSYFDSMQDKQGDGIICREDHGHRGYEDLAFFFSVHRNGILMDVIYNNKLYTGDQLEALARQQLPELEYLLSAIIGD